MALTLQNSSSSSRNGVRKSEGMICSNVLTELRSWGSGPALEDVLEGFFGGSGQKEESLVLGSLGTEGKGERDGGALGFM